MSDAARRAQPRWMWVVVAVFALLHWDFWLWDDRSLWFGFLPAGLGYHALYSLAAGCLWALFIRVAWPEHLETWASGGRAREVRGPADREGER